jgi:fructokinase
MTLFGGIEAGGTKFVCSVAEGPGAVRAEVRFPTTTPEETLQNAVNFFNEQELALGAKVQSVGVACFGPVDLNPTSPTYGYITTTPKPGWANTNVAGALQEKLGVPIAFDHDVVGAAVGEGLWGAAQGLQNFMYITIGTGIGGGIIANGKPLHGLVHPEMGHLRIPHDWRDDPYSGYCSYHGDCFEGLASGPAIQHRWGRSASELPPEHKAWDLEAHYIALALHNMVCTLSTERIILGGGVMQQPQILPKVHKLVQEYLRGYIQSPEILDHIERYIVLPGLGNQAGVLGAIGLAMQVGG